MESSCPLSAELAVLTEALADPDVDLQEQMHRLGAVVRAAVSSFIGLRMTVVVEGYPFTVTTVDDSTDLVDVGASVSITLGAARRTSTTSSVVLYASTPGAFVDLAADAVVHRPHPGAVLVDVHLDDPEGVRPVSGSTGWAEISIVNRAVGVLIGRGHTPEQAQSTLDTRAVSSGLGAVEIARAVVASTVPPHPDRDNFSAE